MQTSGTVFITSQVSNFSELNTCQLMCKKKEECHIHAGGNKLVY